MEFTHLKELVSLFNEGDMAKLKLKNGEFELVLEKAYGSVQVAAPTMVATQSVAQTPVVSAAHNSVVEAVVASTPLQNSGEKINSPMVGTFYRSPSPGADVFVKVGSVVRKGSPVGIIEAMKIMNEIEAEFDCKIVEILVEDGQPVEYDMPLFRVERV